MPTSAAHPAPCVILVRPQMAVNIGMVARAMLNCGLDELRIVAPRDGWPNAGANSAAAGALRVIEEAQIYDDVAAATADCNHIFATTARVRELDIPAYPPRPLAEKIHQFPASEKSAILFGPEASGLSNDDLSYATGLVHYPVNPECTSLNLAQAVLMFAWEWWMAREQTPQQFDREEDTAPAESINIMLDRLESQLDKGQFFPIPENRDPMMGKIRNLINRAEPSEREVKILHGIITALQRSS